MFILIILNIDNHKILIFENLNYGDISKLAFNYAVKIIKTHLLNFIPSIINKY